jgi:DeoR family suf operon transcriptional repressor
MQGGLTNWPPDHRMWKIGDTRVTPSRRRIIMQLKKSEEASVSDLSRALGLTSVTVRHHLQELRREGVVGSPRARRRKGPGRPEMAYSLVPHARIDLPKNYQELCTALVEQLSEEPLIGALTEALIGAGQDLGRAFGGVDETQANRTARIEAFLEQRGYFPRWSHESAGPSLHLANCPYREIAEHVPELCSFDKALLASLTGTDVHLEASIAGGAATCRFQLAGELAV